MRPSEILLLRPNRWVYWRCSVFFSLIAGSGIVIVVRGYPAGWAVWALFTSLAFYSGLAAIPVWMRLELTSDGLTEQTPVRRRTWRWQDFESFSAWQRGEERIVVFRYGGDYQRSSQTSLFGRLDDWDGELISAGMPAEQQADLLNRWLERYAPQGGVRAPAESGESTSSELTEPKPDGKGRSARLRMSPGRSRTAIMVCGLGILNLCLASYQVWAHLWARLFFLGLIGLLGWAVVHVYRSLRPRKPAAKMELIDDWVGAD
jgi:hypothetical protein